jgi:hypothetical protein
MGHFGSWRPVCSDAARGRKSMKQARGRKSMNKLEEGSL